MDWLIGKGKIKVREINKEGCTSAEVEKEITVNEFISNLEIIGDAQICEGKIYTYTFIDGKEGSTFEWEIEGGEIISGQGTTTIKIKWSGKPIRITVKETNMDGCPGQTKELLVVNYNTKDDGYWWGNVITPNGDGKNDCFAIDGLAPECNKLDVKIVNRWGQIVFESTNINDCWDGTLKGSGKLASTGTYYYVLKLKDQKDQAGAFYINR